MKRSKRWDVSALLTTANDVTEFFDFVNPPVFLTPPLLPAQPTTGVDDITKQAPPQ